MPDAMPGLSRNNVPAVMAMVRGMAPVPNRRRRPIGSWQRRLWCLGGGDLDCQPWSHHVEGLLSFGSRFGNSCVIFRLDASPLVRIPMSKLSFMTSRLLMRGSVFQGVAHPSGFLCSPASRQDHH